MPAQLRICTLEPTLHLVTEGSVAAASKGSGFAEAEGRRKKNLRAAKAVADPEMQHTAQVTELELSNCARQKNGSAPLTTAVTRFSDADGDGPRHEGSGYDKASLCGGPGGSSRGNARSSQALLEGEDTVPVV